MVTMTTAAFLCLLLGAVFAAPAEDKDLKVAETPAEAPNNQSSDVAAVHMNFCPRDWKSYGSRCFLFVKRYLDWYSAKDYCHIMGGQLASVQNQQEYNLLQLMAHDKSETDGWLGGFNPQSKWMWLDRSDFDTSGVLFTLTSPTNCPCTFLRGTSKGGNSPCTYSRPFFCSKDPFSC